MAEPGLGDTWVASSHLKTPVIVGRPSPYARGTAPRSSISPSTLSVQALGRDDGRAEFAPGVSRKRRVMSRFGSTSRINPCALPVNSSSESGLAGVPRLSITITLSDDSVRCARVRHPRKNLGRDRWARGGQAVCCDGLSSTASRPKPRLTTYCPVMHEACRQP